MFIRMRCRKPKASACLMQRCEDLREFHNGRRINVVPLSSAISRFVEVNRMYQVLRNETLIEMVKEIYLAFMEGAAVLM